MQESATEPSSVQGAARQVLAVGSDRLVLMLGTSPEMRGGIASVVTALRDGGLFEQARVRYVATHVDGGHLAKIAKFAGAVMLTLRALASRRVALVHAHVSWNASFWRKALLLWIARRFHVPTVFQLHSGGFDSFAQEGRPLRRWCVRHTLESSDFVVVLSNRWADWVRHFAPGARVRIVGNPVRIPATLATRQRGGSPPAGRVLYLGMISDAKGSFDLLRAWVEFRGGMPGWRLVVCGNGEVKRFLAEAERLGIRGDIEYLGWVSGGDKERQLASADIFVLPSHNEGMPVSVLEAMAYGASVIVTPVGGVPDMMQKDVHGLWVEPGDVKGLASCLGQLAGSSSLRNELAAAAREHVLAHYSVEAAVSRICDVYRDAMASRRA